MLLLLLLLCSDEELNGRSSQNTFCHLTFCPIDIFAQLFDRTWIANWRCRWRERKRELRKEPPPLSEARTRWDCRWLSGALEYSSGLMIALCPILVQRDNPSGNCWIVNRSKRFLMFRILSPHLERMAYFPLSTEHLQHYPYHGCLMGLGFDLFSN